MVKLTKDPLFSAGLTHSASRVNIVTLPRKTNKPLTHHDIDQDQQGKLWCGPAVVAALTGATPTQIHELVRKDRKKPGSPVTTTDCDELQYAFSKLGYRMSWAYLYEGQEEQRPTFGRWLRDTAKERVPGIGYVVRITDAREPGGHWVVVLDGFYICNHTAKWVPIEKALFKRCRVHAVFAVRKK